MIVLSKIWQLSYCQGDVTAGKVGLDTTYSASCKNSEDDFDFGYNIRDVTYKCTLKYLTIITTIMTS